MGVIFIIAVGFWFRPDTSYLKGQGDFSLAPLWGICKFLSGLLKGHQGKDQGQRRQLPPLSIRPADWLFAAVLCSTLLYNMPTFWHRFMPLLTNLYYSTGLYLGVKLFLLDNIFRKFPRVKVKYDMAYSMWQSLPTHLQKQRRKTMENRRKVIKYKLMILNCW